MRHERVTVQEETGGVAGDTVSVTQDVDANVGNVTVNGAEAIGQQVDAQAASGNTGSELSSATTSAVSGAISSGTSEAGGASEFVREYTLASGSPYCDCGYKKKVRT